MLRLYNTLGGKLEDFNLDPPGPVRMYVCGPTVYDSAHLGHARPAVVFDVLRRYLEYKGYAVIFVTNFTDVDDKIIARARQDGSSEPAIAARYASEYLEDMDALGIKRASHYPKATEYISDMLQLVRLLVEKGFAYVRDGDVFFRVRRFEGYGKLSGRSLGDIQQARIEPDERKEHPADFALWKAAREGEPYWPSSWGPGRPGWHIECSAMSAKYLAPLPFDIHGGGKDLVFPHHENEIAQTEAAYEKPMARFWLHNGFININKEKMSKSLGNVMNLRALFKRYPPACLRLFLLGTHYRKDAEFAPERLDEAKARLSRILEALEETESLSVRPDGIDISSYMSGFEAALDNDLNTAEALGVIDSTAGHIFFELGTDTPEKLDEQRRRDAAKAGVAVRKMLEILGLPESRAELFKAVAQNASEEKRRYVGRHRMSDLVEEIDLIEDALSELGEGETVDEIEYALDRIIDKMYQLFDLIAEVRSLARQKKLYEISDRIRARLSELGYEMRDLPAGKWEVKRRL